MSPQLFLDAIDRVLPQSDRRASFESIALPTQVSTAIVSLVASLMMAVAIARTGNGLSVPFRRIIFGLSVSDIAQSLGLLIGPISIPRDIPNCWGVGNATSCHISAFIFITGCNAVPLYTCFVCWYYLCKLKYRMSDDRFTQKTEIKIHVSIALFVLVFAIIALKLGTLNPLPAKTHCYLSTVPLGCRIFSDFPGVCDAVITSRVDTLLVMVQSIRAVCILGMIGMMGIILWHVLQQIRIFRPHPSDERRSGVSNTVVNSSQSQENLSNISSLYRNEIVIQTICYVGAFCLTYITEVIIYFTLRFGGHPSEALRISYKFLMPLGGLFNILVYSRPQVASLRRAHPDRSWALCLWLVLKAGGEQPDRPFPDNDNDQGQGSNDDDYGQNKRRPRYSFSSVNPFGIETDESETFDSVQVFDGRSMSLRESDLNFNPEENWSYVRGGSALDTGEQPSPGRDLENG